jgi:hypothetical protein
LEGLKIYNSSKAVGVSVLDTLDNKTTVYPSVSEAARGIGGGSE